MKEINFEDLDLKEIKTFQEFLEDMKKKQPDIKDIKDVILTDISICNKITYSYLRARTNVLNELFALKGSLDSLMFFLRSNEHLFNEELKQNAKDYLWHITRTINRCLAIHQTEINALLHETFENDTIECTIDSNDSKNTRH